MSDDINKKIKQVTDILGQEKLPENLMGLLSLLSTSGNKEDASRPQEEAPALKELPEPISKEEKVSRSELDDNIEFIRRAKKMMDKVSSPNDPRVNLLTAIKPFLNNSRQRKVGNCIKMLNMSRLTKLMDENE